MATKDQQPKKLPLFPLLSLLCFASIFLALSLSLSKRASISNETIHVRSTPTLTSTPCNYSHGSWIYDPNWIPNKYDSTCKEIFKGWNCIAGNKSNAKDIIKWRWQPNGCDLPPFDPVRFLQTFRDTSIGTLSLN